MRQMEISQQLARYLELIQPRNPDLQLLIKKLKKEGFCFGYALTYAAMFVLRKRIWWEELIAAMLAWDGTKAQLKKKIKLTDSNQSKGVKLESLFFRALNYIVYNQMDYIDRFIPKHLNQSNLLLPENKFTLSDGATANLVVKNNERVSGFFQLDDLKFILFEEYIENKICLIHSNRHTISLSYDGKYWIVYDPNFRHEGPDKTAKKYASKVDAINQIFKILGRFLSIELVQVIDPVKPEFSIIEEFIEMLFHDHSMLKNIIRISGLHAIAMHCEKQFKGILAACQNNHDLRTKLLSTLAKRHHKATLFYYIINFQSQHLKAVLDLVAASSDGAYHLSNALLAMPRKKSGFFYLVTRTPSAIPDVFNIIQANTSAFRVFYRVLHGSSYGLLTGFQVLLTQGHNYFPQLIAVFKQQYNGAKLFAKLLAEKKSYDAPHLDFLVTKHPEYLGDVIRLLRGKIQATELFLDTLFQKTTDGCTILDKILAASVDYGSLLLDMLRKHQSLLPGYSNLIRYIIQNTSDRKKTHAYLEFMLNKYTCLEPEIFDLIMVQADTDFLCTHVKTLIKHALTTQDILKILEQVELNLSPHPAHWNSVITSAKLKVSILIQKQNRCATKEENFLLQRSFTLFGSKIRSSASLPTKDGIWDKREFSVSSASIYARPAPMKRN